MIYLNGVRKRLSDEFTLSVGELHIEKGERVALIGPNGSGKSTLLRLIARITAPDDGTVRIGADKDEVGYEPQNAYSFRGTVESNVRLGLKNGADIESVLSLCGLDGIGNKKTNELSGGEKQRMCLARMLAGNYKLLLLDEPLSAADIENSSAMSDVLIKECERAGTTLLMATHLPSQALRIATKVLIMNNGEISEYSDVSDLKSPGSEFGQKFIEQWRIF